VNHQAPIWRRLTKRPSSNQKPSMPEKQDYHTNKHHITKEIRCVVEPITFTSTIHQLKHQFFD
jgi:hypothetical protein